MDGDGRGGVAPGSVRLVFAEGTRPLHPAPQTFEAMLEGWQAQQFARGLAASTVGDRVRVVRRFAQFTNDWPWVWTATDVEEWTVQLRSGPRPAAHSTLRTYQQALALFMAFVTDTRYGWAGWCEQRFGTHPVQICHEWNSVTHTSDYEGRPGNRPFTRSELQALFDHADEQTVRARRLGRKGYLAAFRDATLFKTLYAWGLRRQEAARLETVDVTANPTAPELGGVGMLSVRYGKAARGSPPKRRTVCTVMGWAADALEEWLVDIRPAYLLDGSGALWPTERGGAISPRHINVRFATYRDQLGLPAELGPHCLRHSYVTHLIEDGFDPLFVQQQVGHAWASTTALYTGVSSDFKNRLVRAALDRAYRPNDDTGERNR